MTTRALLELGAIIRRSGRPCAVSAATTAGVFRPLAAVNSLLRATGKRIEKRFPVVFNDMRPRGLEQSDMAKRPLATGTEARAGTKEGVVRYILMASLVLVVLLFIVAYELFT